MPLLEQGAFIILGSGCSNVSLTPSVSEVELSLLDMVTTPGCVVISRAALQTHPMLGAP